MGRRDAGQPHGTGPRHGVLIHAQGRMGNTGKDFNGPWLRSIEFQIIEGGVGDILPSPAMTSRGINCVLR